MRNTSTIYAMWIVTTSRAKLTTHECSSRAKLRNSLFALSFVRRRCCRHAEIASQMFGVPNEEAQLLLVRVGRFAQGSRWVHKVFQVNVRASRLWIFLHVTPLDTSREPRRQRCLLKYASSTYMVLRQNSSVGRLQMLSVSLRNAPLCLPCEH